MLYGDPYNLQGGGTTLQGSSPTLQPAASPQQTASYGSTPQPAPAPTTSTASYTPTPAPTVTATPIRTPVAQPDTQINSIFSPFIGSRPSGVNPGVLEYYNKQTGQGFSSPQDLYSFASTLGAGVINSFDQLHAPVGSSPTFNPQVQDIQPIDQNQTIASNAGTAGLSVDDYLNLVKAGTQLTPEQVNDLQSKLGIPQAAAAAFAPPQQSSVDFYNQLYGSAGLADVRQKILDLNTQVAKAQQDFLDAQGVINENPFLSEASRVGRISRLNDKAQAQINNLINQQTQYQTLYQNGLTEINNLVAAHGTDVTNIQTLNANHLTYLLAQAETQSAALQAANQQKAYQYLPAYLQAKAKAQSPSTVTAPSGATFYYDKNTGTFQQLTPAGGNYDVNPISGHVFSKNTGQDIGTAGSLSFSQNAPAGGFRTDRNNNPTAMTTDVAAASGLVLGKDYVQGDPFTSNGRTYYTAKLLGDPIATTIKAIDQGGFQTASGKPRWSYINMSQQQWNGLSYSQKAQVVAQMYQQEGGSGELVGAQAGQTSGGDVIQSTAQGLVNGTINPNQLSPRSPGYLQILQLANQLSMQQTGQPFDAATAEQNYNAKQQAVNQSATDFRTLQLANQTAIDHLAQLTELSAAATRTSSPLANDAILYTKGTIQGDKNYTSYLSAINVVRGEVAKVLGGGQTTVESLNEAKSILPENLGHTALLDAIQNVKQLMASKIAEYSKLNNVAQYGSPSSGTSNSADPLGLGI